MNFIWDIVLAAGAQGMPKEDLFFMQAEAYSPYYEQSLPCLDQTQLESPLIEYNALYRFSAIFQELLHPDLWEVPENREFGEFALFLFDAATHLLSEVDLQHGLNRREYYVRRLRMELLSGAYGRTAVKAVRAMDRKLQFLMANELLTQMRTGSNLLSFRRAICMAFEDCILYQSNYDCKKLYLYLGRQETQVNARRMTFILDAFLPLGFSVKLFWENHFGVIGVDETMRLEAIALF